MRFLLFCVFLVLHCHTHAKVLCIFSTTTLNIYHHTVVSIVVVVAAVAAADVVNMKLINMQRQLLRNYIFNRRIEYENGTKSTYTQIPMYDFSMLDARVSSVFFQHNYHFFHLFLCFPLHLCSSE